jgi:hypothetical protein
MMTYEVALKLRALGIDTARPMSYSLLVPSPCSIVRLAAANFINLAWLSREISESAAAEPLGCLDSSKVSYIGVPVHDKPIPFSSYRCWGLC